MKELLDAFDALPAAEQHAAAKQLLRRVIEREQGDLPEEGLVAAAEELFLELDAREASVGST